MSTALEEVRAAIAAEATEVAIGESPLDGPAIRSLLDAHLDGQALVVRGVTPASASDPAQVIFDGTARFLGEDMAVVVRLAADGDGALSARLRFQPPPTWRFADGFPALGGGPPADGAGGGEGTASLLDRLLDERSLSGLAFVVPADDGRVADAGGYGLAATLEPTKVGGLVGMVTGPDPVVLTGSVVPARPGRDETDRMTPEAAIGGDGTLPPPGISYRGDVAGPVKLGPLAFGPGQVRVHAPFQTFADPDDAEAGDGADDEADESPAPTLGWVGQLGLGSRTVGAIVVAPPGARSLAVALRPGTTVGGVAELGAIIATDELTAAAPAELGSVLSALPTIELKGLELAVRREGKTVLVDRAAVRVGAKVPWTVIDDVLAAHVDEVTVEVTDPFGQRARREVSLAVHGTVDVAGVGCEVLASIAKDAKVVMARLREGQRIGLGALLSKLLPGVPVPLELEVTRLEVTTLLDPFLAVLVAVALEDPKDFIFGHPDRPVGLTGLALQATVDGGGHLGGELTGTFAVGGAELSLSATQPGAGEGWELHGGLAEGEVIPLGALLADLLPDATLPEALTDLMIDDLEASFDTGYGDVSFSGAITTSIPLDLGPVQPMFRATVTVASGLDPDGVRRTTGSLSGVVEIGEAAFLLEYDLSNARSTLRAEADGLDGLDHIALARAFGLEDRALDVGLPGIDLAITRVAFEVDLWSPQGSGVVLAIESSRYGEVVLAVRRTPAGAWSFVFGFVLGSEGWSPGSLWQPLSVLTIEQAGLFLCSTVPPAEQLRSLVSTTAVPAVLQRRFALQRGLNLAATLRLEGDVEILRTLFGDVRLDLFAAFDPRSGQTSLVARMDFDQTQGAFVFNDFELEWAGRTTSAEIAARASGRLNIGDEKLRYAVAGRLSSDGTAALELAVQDWVHPFGYERLTISSLTITIALSPASTTLTLAGSFGFTTKDGKAFTFAVAGAITGFSAPSAAAFLLRSDSPGQSLKLSEVIEGITTIDLTSLDTPAGFTPMALAVRAIDLVLEIREVRFWVVLADRVTIAGQVYARGFGFRGDITLFGTSVLLYVEVQEAERRFAGSAELPESVHIGKVLSLGRPSGPTTVVDGAAMVRAVEDPGRGPVLWVSSFVDAHHDSYLSVAASVVLFDVIRADLYAKAGDDGLVFSYDLEAGSTEGGAWAGQHVDILVNREKAAFQAGLRCTLGLQDVVLGGFDLFGIVPVPEVRMPDFSLEAWLDVRADASPPTFHLAAAIDFVFMGDRLSGTVALDLDLRDAPAALAEVGASLLAWLKANLVALLEAALDTAEKLAVWVGERFSDLAAAATEVGEAFHAIYGLSAEHGAKLLAEVGYGAEQVAATLTEVFDVGSAVALQTLTKIGFPGDAVSAAMVEVFDWTTTLLVAADQALSSFSTHVEAFLTTTDVPMVLLNMTDHRLEVVGSRGSEITPVLGLQIAPGEAAVVATFGFSTGRWEWVYLRDLDHGVDYQLYIESSSIIGNRYATFGFRDPRSTRDINNPRPVPHGATEATWRDGQQIATYTLWSLPSPRIWPPFTFLPGQRISSRSGKANLVFEANGDLIVCDAHGQARWRSETNAAATIEGGATCTFQDDGNLVVRTSQRQLWTSGTAGLPNAYLFVQDDGNVVIYDAGDQPRWATGTEH